MASIKVTNLDTTGPTYLSDFYSQLDTAGGGGSNISRTFSRPAGEIPRLTSLSALLAAGKVSVEITPTADELSAGLLTPPLSVQAVDVAPAQSGLGVPFSGRVSFAAAGSQDLTVWAPGTPKFGAKKFRITKAWCRITTNIMSSVLRLRTRGANGGTLLAEVAAAAAGVNQENANVTATTLVDMTGQPLDGLFLYKTDAGLNGELFFEGMIED